MNRGADQWEPAAAYCKPVSNSPFHGTGLMATSQLEMACATECSPLLCTIPSQRHASMVTLPSPHTTS